VPPRRLAYRQSFRSECLDRAVTIAIRIELRGPFGPLPGTVGHRPSIGDEWTLPSGVCAQWLVPRRAPAGIYLDGLLPVALVSQQAASFTHVAERQRQTLALRRIVRSGRIADERYAFSNDAVGKDVDAGKERHRADHARPR
jgi:hypothetical protein